MEKLELHMDLIIYYQLIYVQYYKKNLSGHIFATKIVETFDNINQKSIIMRADD